MARVYQALKRLLVGRPLSSAEQEHQRLIKTIAPAFPGLRHDTVPLCLLLIALITLANLRGVKESGRTFAVPTYVYIFSLTLLVGIGLVRPFTGHLHKLPPDPEAMAEITRQGKLMTGITLFALMRAFSSGAVALTGVEAISNGVPAFRRPESKNAATTLMWMAAILGGFFFGISVLAHRVAATLQPEGHETILSILGRAVFGHNSAMYF